MYSRVLLFAESSCVCNRYLCVVLEHLPPFDWSVVSCIQRSKSALDLQMLTIYLVLD